MLKKIFVVCLFFFSISIFAAKCPEAKSYDGNFCSIFESAVRCHCKSAGFPAGMCGVNMDMKLFYKRLMAASNGSLEQLCSSQHHTSQRECVDDWNCYWKGGKDSMGRLCSSTGRPCQS